MLLAKFMFCRVAVPLAALGVIGGCEAFGGYPAVSSGAVVELAGVCTRLADCAPYEPCVVDGSVWCESRRCFGNGRIDLDCVDSINAGSTYPAAPDAGYTPAPPPAALCQTVTRPGAQLGDRGYCNSWPVRSATDVYANAWFNCVGYTPDSRCEVVSATVYAAGDDGTLTAIAGSALGQQPIAWAGAWPYFFRAGDDTHRIIPAGAPHSYAAGLVPVEVEHMGVGAAVVGGYREAVLIATVRTTGTAQIQGGMDYMSTLSDMTRREGAQSDWVSCTSGTITISTPLSIDPATRGGYFCGARTVTTAPPAPPPSPPPAPHPSASPVTITWDAPATAPVLHAWGMYRLASGGFSTWGLMGAGAGSRLTFALTPPGDAVSIMISIARDTNTTPYDGALGWGGGTITSVRDGRGLTVGESRSADGTVLPTIFLR